MSARRYGFQGTVTGTLGRFGLPDAHGDAGPLLAVLSGAEPMIGPDLAWQDRASCAEVDGELFFPEKGGSTREAKQVCRECDVRAECLGYALEHGERFGIWGGLSERQRRPLAARADVTAAIAADDARRSGRQAASQHRQQAHQERRLAAERAKRAAAAGPLTGCTEGAAA